MNVTYNVTSSYPNGTGFDICTGLVAQDNGSEWLSTNNESCQFDSSAFPEGSYDITIKAFNTQNTKLATTDTTTNSFDIFDYLVVLGSELQATGVNSLRTRPDATITRDPLLGQTETIPAMTYTQTPASNIGLVNLTIALNNTMSCVPEFYCDYQGTLNISRAVNLTASEQQFIETPTGATQNVWCWVTKRSCTTSHLGFTIDFDVLP